MARLTTPLTAKEIQSAKASEKERKLFDGGGLYIAITPKGGKSWRLKYRFKNKEFRLALGVYPALSLMEARKLREMYKAQIAEGINPSYEKKKQKEAETIQEVKDLNTFERLALQRLEKVRDDISESHYKRMLGGFKNDVFPLIGSMPIDDIEASDIINLLQLMMKRGVRNSAKQVYSSISKTFKWSVANSFAKRNPCADIELIEIIGKPSEEHYATITDDEGIKNLLTSIDEYQGELSTKYSLLLLAYTFVRSINVRLAEWKEIDFKAKLWSIPAKKMKTRDDFIVPLSDTVIDFLQDMQKYSGDSPYLFPSTKSKTTPLSDGALLGAIRRMGYTKEEFTPHGFRAMFSTNAHQKSPFKSEVIETQLAHSVGNAVSQAYNRAKYLDERVELMQWWSDYLDNLII